MGIATSRRQQRGWSLAKALAENYFQQVTQGGGTSAITPAEGLELGLQNVRSLSSATTFL